MSERNTDEAEADMKMLEPKEAASNAEEVIQFVCEDCRLGNLDFSEPNFCPIQAEYSLNGQHPAIVGEFVGGKWNILCTEWKAKS